MGNNDHIESAYNPDAWENQTISNDFMFSKVMEDKELCRDLIRIILPELNVMEIEDVQAEKTLKHYYVNKGVRLDIYAADDKGRIYDIEMQLITNMNIPKRSRYYSSMMDANELLKGMDYEKLSDSYVIFICVEDLFEKGRSIYTFENRCIQDIDIPLNDG